MVAVIWDVAGRQGAVCGWPGRAQVEENAPTLIKETRDHGYRDAVFAF